MFCVSTYRPEQCLLSRKKRSRSLPVKWVCMRRKRRRRLFTLREHHLQDSAVCPWRVTTPCIIPLCSVMDHLQDSAVCPWRVTTPCIIPLCSVMDNLQDSAVCPWRVTTPWWISLISVMDLLWPLTLCEYHDVF